MGLTPTSRTIAALKAMGYRVGRTEHWNAFAKIRQDLFGCVDVIGLKAGAPLLLIQTTTGENVSHRLEKAKATGMILASTGNVFEIWGWRKIGERGEQKRWAVRRLRIYTNGEEVELPKDCDPKEA
jgi:hypothetical protein